MAQKDDGLDLSGVTRKHLEDEITRQLQTDFKYKGNISGLPGSGQKDQEKEMQNLDKRTTQKGSNKTGTFQRQQMALNDEELDLSGVTRKHKEDEITRKQQTANKSQEKPSWLSDSNLENQEENQGLGLWIAFTTIFDEAVFLNSVSLSTFVLKSLIETSHKSEKAGEWRIFYPLISRELRYLTADVIPNLSFFQRTTPVPHHIRLLVSSLYKPMKQAVKLTGDMIPTSIIKRETGLFRDDPDQSLEQNVNTIIDTINKLTRKREYTAKNIQMELAHPKLKVSQAKLDEQIQPDVEIFIPQTAKRLYRQYEMRVFEEFKFSEIFKQDFQSLNLSAEDLILILHEILKLQQNNLLNCETQLTNYLHQSNLNERLLLDFAFPYMRDEIQFKIMQYLRESIEMLEKAIEKAPDSANKSVSCQLQWNLDRTTENLKLHVIERLLAVEQCFEEEISSRREMLSKVTSDDSDALKKKVKSDGSTEEAADTEEKENVELGEQTWKFHSTNLTEKGKIVAFNYRDSENNDGNQKIEVCFPPFSVLGTVTINFELQLNSSEQCVTPLLYMSQRNHLPFLRKISVSLPWKSSVRSQIERNPAHLNSVNFRKDVVYHDTGVVISSFSFSPIAIRKAINKTLRPLDDYDERRLFDSSRMFFLMKQNPRPNLVGLHEFILDLRAFYDWAEQDQFRWKENWNYEPITYDESQPNISIQLKEVHLPNASIELLDPSILPKEFEFSKPSVESKNSESGNIRKMSYRFTNLEQERKSDKKECFEFSFIGNTFHFEILKEEKLKNLSVTPAISATDVQQILRKLGNKWMEFLRKEFSISRIYSSELYLLDIQDAVVSRLREKPIDTIIFYKEMLRNSYPELNQTFTEIDPQFQQERNDKLRQITSYLKIVFNYEATRYEDLEPGYTEIKQVVLSRMGIWSHQIGLEIKNAEALAIHMVNIGEEKLKTCIKNACMHFYLLGHIHSFSLELQNFLNLDGGDDAN
ncbi:uncharacterized protein LOC134852829 isoform X3 [Symsagittifera roscoffensis]